MVDVAERHRLEVKKGDRFAFGQNWSRFLKRLTSTRIGMAEKSLRDFLGVERLDGKSFIDIGSGSGLFSLAARRLGARVHSFDYDQHSVACTREMRRRFFPDDPNWTVEQASALDEAYMSSLGRFDVVYSWGVLHHTGAMWAALDNVKPLVPLDGKLFIAIYNDLGPLTDEWARIKQRYNSLPRPVAFFYALGHIFKVESVRAISAARAGFFREYVKGWTHYDTLSTRGMSRWHDWIDWIGGYPYERAKVEQIVEFYSRDGFELIKLEDSSAGWGCHQFVFRRVAPAGVYVESLVPGGNSIAWRFGHRVLGPFERSEQGEWTGVVINAAELPVGTPLYLIRDQHLVGQVRMAPGNRVAIARGEEDIAAIEEDRLHLVAARQLPLVHPFTHIRGHMWEAPVPQLVELADGMQDQRRSPVFLFEDGHQLPRPHSFHDDIAKEGGGRFSHWGSSLVFSASDNSDPNRSGRSYVALVPPQPLPAERSVAQRCGTALPGPFSIGKAGWTTSTQASPEMPQGELYLIRDDNLVGPVVRDSAGHIVVASAEEPGERLERAKFYLVAGQARGLVGPFQAERGHMFSKVVPEWGELGDASEQQTRSPVFLFENGHQLPYPHTAHDVIAEFGGGRYSHWGATVYFSTLEGDDPNAEGFELMAFIPAGNESGSERASGCATGTPVGGR